MQKIKVNLIDKSSGEKRAFMEALTDDHVPVEEIEMMAIHITKQCIQQMRENCNTGDLGFAFAQLLNDKSNLEIDIYKGFPNGPLSLNTPDWKIIINNCLRKSSETVRVPVRRIAAIIALYNDKHRNNEEPSDEQGSK